MADGTWITETESDPPFVTYANAPSELKATLHGNEPTEIGPPKTACEAVSMTETVPEKLLATYANLPSGLMATP